MREESLSHFETLTNHYSMFDELGKDITFLPNTQEISRYIDANFDTILFDCDGVLYRETDPIPDAAVSLNSLMKHQHKKLLFVTNNAGSSRMQLRDKLAKILDCPSLEESQMVASSYPAARYVQKIFDKKEQRPMEDLNVHIIGTNGSKRASFHEP